MTQADHGSTNQYLERAVALATRNVADGGGPFGALVVTKDGQVHEGVNRVTRDNDPTAHAEVVAIRRLRRRCGASTCTVRSSTPAASRARCAWLRPSGRV